ncbi:YfhO family protein [Leuconostoc holzapfelii]|uniref:YfhO family protein n=1 Tax=Leuconostoc holzapfelii TaxID=434464 RepID=A0A846ZGJ9_9LACO|nr:YfhO family protein [Leuconostoc holzapfelii]NKZ18909.1 YfhO family protein [Leuconostoc holzapfelii]
MKKRQFFLSPLALSFWLPALIMLSYYAYRGMAPFGQNSILTVDLGQQYIDQFAAFKTAFLAHPSSFFYSFSNALGGDMLGEWAYYLMSPFNLIFLFVPNINLPAAILGVTVLKFGAAGLTMAYLIKRLQLQKGYYTTLFAVNYALSGWFIANDLNLLWLDAAILLPLVILQIEQLFVQNTWWRYALILGATIICNYYIGYMIAIFITLYFVWRLTWPQQSQPRWLSVKQFVYGSLTGGALSAWLLLPTIYQLRIGKSQYNSPFSWRFDNNPLQLLAKLIPGSFDFNQMQTGQANFYVSAFILITVVPFFTTKLWHWRVKLGGLGILCFLLLATTWAPLTLFFHGFQYPVWYPYRFSFIISFFLIYLAAMAWHPNWQPKLRTVLGYLIMLLVIVAYTTSKVHQLPALDQRAIVIFAGLFLITLSQFVLQQHDRFWLPLLFVVTLGSLTVNVYLTLNHFSYLTNTEYQNAIKALQSANQPLKKDPSWHRVAQTFQRTRGDAMMLDYYGGSHFSSAMPKATPTFFGNFGQPDGDNYVAYTNGSLLSDAMLGMKYLITPNPKSKEQAGEPKTLLVGHRPDTANYHLNTTTPTTMVWQNPYALPVAFAANPAALSTQFLTNNPLENQANLWQALTGANVSPLQVANFDQAVGHHVTTPKTITNAVIAKTQSNRPASLDLHFTPKTNDSYYLTIGSGLQIKDFDLLINGQIIKQFSTYRHTIVINLASQVKDQPQVVTLRFKQANALVLNNVTLYHINQTAFQQQAKQLATHPIHITHRNERQLTGTITTTTQQSLIMTSIPNAPGWHVTLDGRNITPMTVGDYLIAVKTTPGQHTISWRYTPPLFWLGVVISSLALAGVLFAFIRQKKLASS